MVRLVSEKKRAKRTVLRRRSYVDGDGSFERLGSSQASLSALELFSPSKKEEGKVELAEARARWGWCTLRNLVFDHASKSGLLLLFPLSILSRILIDM